MNARRFRFIAVVGLATLLGVGSVSASNLQQSAPVVVAPGSNQTLTCSTSFKVIPTSLNSVTLECAAQASATATPVLTLGPATTTPALPVAGAGIWLSPAEVAALPISGSAFNQVNSAANGSWGSPNLSDLNSNHDVLTLAGALICARLHNAAMCAKTAAAIHSAIGTESSSRGLEVSRNITSYVIAADLINYHDAGFTSWLSALRTKTMTDGRTIVSTQQDRPNNWGAMAGTARISIDLYLNDTVDLAKAIAVFKGRLGDTTTYNSFAFGDLSWQPDPAHPVAIAPVGAMKSGLSLDGVQPDDQRRSGVFTTTPPCGSYPFESLQGITMSAQLLFHSGQPSYQWSSQAVRRAWNWVYTVPANCKATGDDGSYPVLVNRAYGTTFATDLSRPTGKNGGWFAWTHGS